MAVYGFDDEKNKVNVVDKEDIQLEQALTFEAWDRLTYAIDYVCEALKKLNAKAYDEDINSMIERITTEQAEMAGRWEASKEKMVNW